jgi:hypothetical protein
MRKEKKDSPFKALKEALMGFMIHSQVTSILKMKTYTEYLFMIMTMGDMLGMPLLPPYYSLRLLPYMVPNIKSWKLRMLRDRDVTDIVVG